MNDPVPTSVTDPVPSSVTEPVPAPVASIGLVLDCTDPELLSRFWSVALGYTIVGRAGSYVALTDPTRRGPKLLLQQVPEAKTTKNRMHFDIDTRHVDDEVRRLCAIGAVRVDADPHYEHGTRWVVLSDPEGNEFCVCDSGRPAH